MKNSKEITVITISGSLYSGKNQTPFQRIHNQIVGGEFEAKKDGKEFSIPISSVIKKLELNNPRSEEADWIRQRMQNNASWKVKKKFVKEKSLS